MITIFRRQRRFIDDHVHSFCKLGYVQAAFNHQFELFLERSCVKRIKHLLVVRIISFEVFQHLCKRVEPLCRNFTARNSHAFFNGGYCPGTVVRISGFRVDTSSANRTWVRIFRNRSKSNDRSSFGHFARNSNTAVGRNINGLRYGHKVNIARKKAESNAKIGAWHHFGTILVDKSAFALKNDLYPK